MLQIDVFGYQYDDAVPSFLEAGAFWWHRPTGRLLTKASVAAVTPARTMGAKESGAAPAAWAEEHLGLPVEVVTAVPVVNQAPTVQPPDGQVTAPAAPAAGIQWP